MTAWINVSDLSANRYIIAKALPFAPEIGYILGVGTSGQLFGYFGGTRTTATANSLIAVNTWYHVGIQVSGFANSGVNTGSLWINGIHKTAGFTVTPLSNSAPTVNVRIGGAGNTASGVQLPFKGYIDEVMIWKAVFSPEQWLELYNNGRPGNPKSTTYGLLKKLQSWYRMGDGDTYPTVLDSTGSITGSMNGMTAANFTSSVP